LFFSSLLRNQFPLPDASQGKFQMRVKIMGSTTFTNTLQFQFPPPVLADVSPKNFPTNGSTELVLTGANFGVDLSAEWERRRVRISALETVAWNNSWTPNAVVLSSLSETAESICTVTEVCDCGGVSVDPYSQWPHRCLFALVFAWLGLQWTPTTIRCLTPSGFGSRFAPVVRVSMLCNTLGCSTASQQSVDARRTGLVVGYDPPRLFRVEPNHGPTAGGYNVSIFGSSFGSVVSRASATLRVISNGRFTALPLPIVYLEHSMMVVTMAPAAGRLLDVSVAIGDQVGTGSGAWSFLPPTLHNLSVAACVADAAVTVDVYGSDLGLLDSTVSMTPVVYLGSQLCTQVTVVGPSHLQCTAQPAAVGAYPVVGTWWLVFAPSHLM
jgi:hypothetical protein